jgi:hypothetical protein
MCRRLRKKRNGEVECPAILSCVLADAASITVVCRNFENCGALATLWFLSMGSIQYKCIYTNTTQKVEQHRTDSTLISSRHSATSSLW